MLPDNSTLWASAAGLVTDGSSLPLERRVPLI